MERRLWDKTSWSRLPCPVWERASSSGIREILPEVKALKKSVGSSCLRTLCSNSFSPQTVFSPGSTFWRWQAGGVSVKNKSKSILYWKLVPFGSSDQNKSAYRYHDSGKQYVQKSQERENKTTWKEHILDRTGLLGWLCSKTVQSTTENHIHYCAPERGARALGSHALGPRRMILRGSKAGWGAGVSVPTGQPTPGQRPNARNGAPRPATLAPPWT